MSKNKRLNATITIGGAVAGTLRSAFGTATKSMTQLGSEVKRLTDRQKDLNRVVFEQEKLGRSASALKVQYARDELRMVGQQVIALNSQIAAERKLGEAIKFNAAEKAKIKGKMAGAIGMGVGLGAMVAGPVAVAVKFETAMLGVAKQLDGARDSAGKLTKTYYDMVGSVKQLGHELPIPTNQIAEMVAAGLRMGVAKDQVIDFVRESAKMSTAFDLPAGDLAEQMGKIATLYKVPIPAIGELADSINYLDDNAISKGGDIIDFLQRVGGVAASVKITGQNMAAIGSTLLTMGERSETASTATNAFFQKLAAAEKGTKKFHEYLAELSLSDKNIQKGMQKDALGTMLKVLDRVGKLKPEKRLGVLVEMVGLEHSDTIAKLSSNMEELRKQIDLANSDKAHGSMSREFAARMETTAAQTEIAKNKTMELEGALGGSLLPTINKTLGAIGPYVVKLAQLADEHPEVTKGVVTLGGALVGLRIGALAARFAWVSLQGAMLTNPIGLTIAGFAAGAALIWNNWEPLAGYFKSFWGDVVGSFKFAIDQIRPDIEWLGQKWQEFKNLSSDSWQKLGGEFDVTGQPASLLPSPPLANHGKVVHYNDNSPISINVTQRPGEDQAALAKRVAEEIERTKKAKERAAMYDGAYAQ